MDHMYACPFVYKTFTNNMEYTGDRFGKKYLVYLFFFLMSLWKSWYNDFLLLCQRNKTPGSKRNQICGYICDAKFKWHCNANRYNKLFFRKTARIIIHNQLQIIQVFYWLFNKQGDKPKKIPEL